MAEITVIRDDRVTTPGQKSGSLKRTLDGKNVLVDFEVTFNYDEETNKVSDSSSHSYLLQEVEIDYPPGIPIYTQKDTAGLIEWEKLNKSGAKTPGGKPLAFERDGKKFIVISEHRVTDGKKEETVFNKQWYDQNIISNDIVPDLNILNVRNFNNLHKELSEFQSGKSSEVVGTLDQERITAVQTEVNNRHDTIIPQSDAESLIGFRKTVPPKKEDIGDGETPEDKDNSDLPARLISGPPIADLKDDRPDDALFYPIDMDENNMDYLLIKAINYEKIGDKFIRGKSPTPGALVGGIDPASIFNPDGPKYKKGFGSLIFLPIPSNIGDGNSVSFAENSLDAFSAGVAQLTDMTITKINNMLDGLKNNTQLEKEFSDTFKDLGPDVQSLLKKQLFAQAANLTGISNVSFQSLLARETGSILNPNKELLFNGVNLRTFKFSFKLTPRSRKEGIEVKEIIRSLKRNMAPKIGTAEKAGKRSGSFLRTPSVFELQYMKGRERHPFLNYFKTCALTDMSVKYTGENTYSTYDEGTPVSMIMDLTFKELEPIFDIDYDLDANKKTKSVGY